MKIFISWSEDRSKRVALALKEWLPCVLHSAEPFMSEKDIIPGSGWLSEIAAKLRNSQVGIICLTPECVERPWLNFEAGALTRELEGRTNLVIPYLFGFEAEPLRGPLSHFQTIRAEEGGTLELLKTLNAEAFRLSQFPMSESVLSETFSRWWPSLSGKLNAVANLPHPRPLQTASTFPYAAFYYGKGKLPRNGPVFQDFRTVERVKKGNVNVVQYLWADSSAGSEIQAKVVKGQPVVRVQVTTAGDSYPCNIAIRGKDESPLLNEPRRKLLVFAVRLCDARSQDGMPVCIAIRVVNGLLQHWVYGTGATTYICEQVRNSNEWTVLSVDLQDAASWRRFESDGNPDGLDEANFDCICSVVLEIGIQGSTRPDRQGTAVVDIGPIVLLDDKDDYAPYMPPG